MVLHSCSLLICATYAHRCNSGLFYASAYLGNMLTLLDGAEYTLVNWEHGLSDISGFFYDIMLKDMCQARELDSQLLLSV